MRVRKRRGISYILEVVMMTLVITALASVVLTWGISTISQTRSQLSGAINGRINRLSESTVIEDVQLVAAGSAPCPLASACLEIWIRNTGSIQSVIDQVYVNNIAVNIAGACLNSSPGTLCTPSSSTTKLSLPIQGIGAVEVSYTSSIPLVTGSATSGSTITLTDTTKTWITSQWQNFVLSVVLGTDAGQSKTISSNTSTQLNVAAFSSPIDSTSQYAINCGATTPFCHGATFTVTASTTRGTLTSNAFTV
ncbi:MAG: hypothetical protein LYZ66_07050 [Nitrososphaerales archaeon]|nr:hypothetical protein [Nitrososphaerales archaeon]